MDDRTNGGSSARVYLQPVAPPSILGLYGFAGATFIVATSLAGWWGGSTALQFAAPFAALFGGLAQFVAGMWAYRARDGLATAMHGMWGSYWMAWGILELLFASGTLTEPRGAFVAFGYWFVVLAAITAVGTIAAIAENLGLVAVLGTLTIGAALLAIGLLVGGTVWETVAGWVLILSALLAFYTASALMLEGTFGRKVLPLGQTERARRAPEVDVGAGEPGVAHGQ